MAKMKNQIISDIISELSRLSKESDFSIPSETLAKFKSLLPLQHNRILSTRELYELNKITILINKCRNNPKDETLKMELISHIEALYTLMHGDALIPTTIAYVTEDYLTKNISEFEQRINDLNKKLDGTKQSEEQKEIIRKELEESKEQVKQIKADKYELEKKLDAQENIKKKITDAFEELKNHISHLEKEKKRLNRMFNVYAFLCFCVLGILVYFEFVYLSKWEAPTQLIDYLPFYIPVPIVGGLLWAFIYQLNRAQRQLMLVAYELYHVDYVEGLLQAINMVSPSVTSASDKIGNVLDVMIKKHITIPNELFETSLDKEISKDNIDLKTFVNLAKDVKGVIK